MPSFLGSASPVPDGVTLQDESTMIPTDIKNNSPNDMTSQHSTSATLCVQ